MSLREIDERIKQTKISNLLAMNQLGEQGQLEQAARFHNIALLVGSGLLVLVTSLMQFEGYLTDYLRVTIALITVFVMAWSYMRGGVVSMLGIAAILALNGIYQLIVVNLASGIIQWTSILLGVMQIGFALYYIQKANAFKDLQQKTAESADTEFYQAIYETLNDSRANNSNQLIELSEFKQTILVWLRPSGVVILLKGEKRLFFDPHKSFELNINGQDTGGDRIKVIAKIIDKPRYCSLSRHAWLRYMRFSRQS